MRLVDLLKREKRLKKLIEDSEKELKSVQEALRRQRRECKHDWKYEGDGMGWKMYTCSKCGAAEMD